jgi:uncharacterized protein with NRDE domain
MCLILFAFQSHPQYPLIVAANRDENYARPTRSAHFWQDNPDLYAGKDLEAGGTWMGVTRSGRFCAVTNFREFPKPEHGQEGDPLLSRGELTANYLLQASSPQNYLSKVMQRKNHYAGFNLLAGSHGELHYCSNRMSANEPQALSPGIYGLSNGLLDEPWPKVELGKKALSEVLIESIDPEEILSILLDKSPADDKALPNTGIGIEYERVLSSRFIQAEHYGTRASSVLMISHQGEVIFLEKNFGPGQPNGKTERALFKLKSY